MKLFADNYRGARVFALGGLALLPVAGWVAWAFGPVEGIGVAALAGVGLLDDLAGDRSVGGFSGHLRAAASGRITTGFVKLVVGGIVCLVLAFSVRESLPEALLAATAAALAVNTINLLDLRPGRAVKFWLVFVGVTVLGAGLQLPAVFFPLVVLLGYLVADLREKVMLGDVGANLLGGVLAVGIVRMSVTGLVVTLLVHVAINAYSEVRRISDLIANTPGLRQFDEFGRVPTK